MARNSFRDPVTGVLKAHGKMENNEPGDIKQSEQDGFNLKPGLWQWNGSSWVSFTPPTPQREIDTQDLLDKIDDLIADGTLPNRLRLFAAALRKLFE